MSSRKHPQPTTVRFVDADAADQFDYPVVSEWIATPAAPYPWPSSPLGMGPARVTVSPWATTYVDPLEASRWAETPAPDAPAFPAEWAMPTEVGPTPTAGVELVTRWIAGAEVAVPAIVRRVRPPVRRIVRTARWVVAGSALTLIGLAVLGMAVR